MTLIILETDSIVEAYKGLDRISSFGHIPLEFSPNANGARVLFKALAGKEVPSDLATEVCDVSESIVKAYLSLSDAKLLEMMLVVESSKLVDMLKVAQALEERGAKVLEVRSFKSNPKINYSIVSYNSDMQVSDLVEKYKHVIIRSANPAIQDFLGFKI